MEMYVFVVKKVSRKEGKEPFTYFQMFVDCGYRNCVLTMDLNTISEVTQMPINCLYDLKENEPLKVADYYLRG